MNSIAATQQIETGTPDLQAHLDAGVMTLILNRPRTRNALTPEMVEALGSTLAAAEKDANVRCIVLTGAGNGFCSGGDVKAMAEQDDASAKRSDIDGTIHLQRLAQRATAGKLFEMPKPTIAAINGPAAGAGLSLALACDIRIMSASAILLTAFAKVGLSGDFGASYFLTQLTGTAKARELFFLSDPVTAEDALRFGLTNYVCDPAQLEARTIDLARRFAAGPSTAFRFMKENLNRAISGGLNECLDLESTHHVHCFTTSDHQEGVKAFLGRRPS